MSARAFAMLAALWMLGGCASAQSLSGGQPLSVERIFGADAVRLQRVVESKWFGGGDYYTVIEGGGLVRIEAETGARSVLATAADLTPQGATAPIEIGNYQWSEDGNYLLVLTNARRLWRTDAIGDYWLLDLRTKALRRIGGDAEASSLMYAAFSPDSARIAYVHGNDLYVEPTAGGARRRLTTDGSDIILNGAGDWVNEEEFGIRDAFRWSPDSRRIAYWRFDTEGVGTFYMVKNTDAVYSTVIPLQYPKPGTTNSAISVGVVSVDGGATTWFALGGDPRQHYVPRMDWAANSSEVLIQHMDRAQQHNRVLIGQARDGSVRELFVEAEETWVEANETPKWFRNGASFAWLSERDGWRHLYLVSRDGRDVQLRTPGDFDIVSVENIDEAGGYVYYTASPDNPTQRYLFRSPLFGVPAVERLTPVGAEGSHDYRVAPNSRWAFHTASRFAEPPRTDIVRLPDHRSARSVVENPEMTALIAETPRGGAEFFRAPASDGTQLDVWMMTPPDFDPAKKYPLLIYVYSEPAGQTVSDRWGGDRYLWHLMLTQQGYIVASIDSRGANSPRGRDWRRSVYGSIGVLAARDQADALSALLESRPYIDRERVGIWGASGGGAMTLNALFRYPELYALGVAIAPVTDQRLYNSIYQERFMGTPQGNPDGYAAGSPITHAANLRGDLLLIHGTGDDNVHYQNTEQLADVLIAHNKQFSIMAYPDRTHALNEKNNTRVHMYTLITDFLRRHLPPE